MCEKVAERDVTRGATWFAAHNKAGEQIAEWLLQVEIAFLMEQHREGGGGRVVASFTDPDGNVLGLIQDS